MEQLELIPDIPDEIKFAAENGKLVIFVGAGVSRLVGSPGWSKFADDCLDFLANPGDGKNSALNFSEVEQLKTLDAKKKLSIALKIAGVGKLRIPYEKIIQPKKLQDKDHIYVHLRKFDCPFVTTNYDNYLVQDYENELASLDDSLSQSNPINANVDNTKPGYSQLINSEEFSRFALYDKTKVIHLHGALTETNSMIVSTVDYLKHYSKKEVKDFLTQMFSTDICVLFIGYGLEELEILEFVVRDIQKSASPKHFLLQGFYSHQAFTFEHLKSYYKEDFGIQLIGFSKDSNNHGQLTCVLKDWGSQLNFGEPADYDDLNLLMRVIHE